MQARAMRLGLPAVFLVILILGVIWVASSAAQNPPERESLRGLSGIYIVIEPLHQDIILNGLLEGQLQADTDQRLRQAAIHVLTAEDWANGPRPAFLYININSIKLPTGAYANSIEVALNQPVQLQRLATQRLWVPTWRATAIYVVDKDHVQELRAVIGKFVERFAKDFAAANPADQKNPKSN